MSVKTQIERISAAVGNAYTACNGKGAVMPTARVVANLADCIETIFKYKVQVVAPDTYNPAVHKDADTIYLVLAEE